MKILIFLGLIVLGQHSVAGSELTPPVAPVVENCERDGRDHEGNPTKVTDYQCSARNQQAQRAYSIQMSGHQQALSMQAQERAAAQSAEQQRLAQQAQLASAKAAAEAADNKNKEGSKIYQLASIGCGIASAGYAVAFAGSCAGAGATCQYPLLFKSLAFAALSMLASKQASSHDSVAYNACEVAGKVSAEGGNCGTAPPPYNPQSFPSTQAAGATSLFTSDGKCIGAQADCDKITTNLPPGVKLTDAIKGLSSFGSKGLVKVDKDGNLITKDGKKFKPTDFLSEKDMVAAGISASDAKSLSASIASSGVGAGLDAKAALSKENKSDGTFGDAGGAAGSGKVNAGSAANGSLKGDGKDIGGGARGPASAEGLAKDFNGELIGVAGDDIFKMMNRRYKLKTAQDNFLAP